MPLPANVATCTVTGCFVNGDGTTASGTVEFVPNPPRMLDVTSGPPTTILAVPQVVALDATGAFTVELMATDDVDVNPVDWTYQVRVRVGGYAAYSFDMAAPEGTLDLASVTPVVYGTAGNAVVVVTGPEGPIGPFGPEGPPGPVGPVGPPGIWVSMTLAEYEALPVKDPNTLYVIIT